MALSSAPSKRAFTLIELLIVVAIIAILAAIAVPNFLEAQTRSKVSRVKADMRSLATAIEAYTVDYNKPPITNQFFSPRYTGGDTFNNRLRGITTPVAYITALPIDIFFQQTNLFPITPGQPPTFEYTDWSTGVDMASYFGTTADYNLFISREVLTAYYGNTGVVDWVMNSAGPDRKNDFQSLPGSPKVTGTAASALILGTNQTYDSTNGTISDGDIARTNAQQRN